MDMVFCCQRDLSPNPDFAQISTEHVPLIGKILLIPVLPRCQFRTYTNKPIQVRVWSLFSLVQATKSPSTVNLTTESAHCGGNKKRNREASLNYNMQRGFVLVVSFSYAQTNFIFPQVYLHTKSPLKYLLWRKGDVIDTVFAGLRNKLGSATEFPSKCGSHSGSFPYFSTTRY